MEAKLTTTALSFGKRLTDYNDPKSLASRLRARRAAPLMNLIKAVHEVTGRVSILDIGGRKTYWNIIPSGMLERYGVRITILNLPEEAHDEGDSVFTISPGDACNLSQYADNAFDIVHSNSVVEHVGNWSNMKRFAGEANRLAPCLFIQTPYYWFPIEPHFIAPFFHWLPRPFRISLIMRFSFGRRGKAANLDEAIQMIEDEPVLLDQRMFTLLFPGSKILKERFFFAIKSIVAYRSPRTQGA